MVEGCHFGGVHPSTLARMLRNGERMDAPENSACSSEVYVCYFVRHHYIFEDAGLRQ